MRQQGGNVSWTVVKESMGNRDGTLKRVKIGRPDIPGDQENRQNRETARPGRRDNLRIGIGERLANSTTGCPLASRPGIRVGPNWREGGTHRREKTRSDVSAVSDLDHQPCQLVDNHTDISVTPIEQRLPLATVLVRKASPKFHHVVMII